MFNEKQVCEHLLTLCSAKSPEDRDVILGKIVCEIRSKLIVKQGYPPREIMAVVQHIVGSASLEKEDERGDYIERAVASLNSEFRMSLGTWNFVIPIENLKLQSRSFKVGDVMFFTFTPYRRKQMRARLWKLIKDNPHYDNEWKRNYLKSRDKEDLSQIKDKTCAFVQVTGRLEKAQLIACDKAETAVATLKLYRYSLYDEHREYFHVTGKVVPRTNRVTLRYSEDGQNISTLIESVGFLFPFNLDNKRMRFMRRAGFPKINEILKKEKPNKLEKNIITSIRLFASACDVVVTKSRIMQPIGLGFPPEKESKPQTFFEEISLSDRLIRLFIALESLLIFDENESLASNMSERGAFLLVKNMKSKKETYDERKKIRDFIAGIYRLRSAYVHHGESKINHTKLRTFMRLVQNIILTVVLIKDRMKLTTPQHLKDWFERKKLS